MAKAVKRRETAKQALKVAKNWIETAEEPYVVKDLVLPPTLPNDNVNHWIVSIMGPAKSMYQGGKFEIDFEFPKNYPTLPPKVKCLTCIYHINISSNGHICLPFFDKDGWSANKHSVTDIIMGIIELLRVPDVSDPVNAHAFQLYKENEQLFGKVAQLWVTKYACKEHKKFDEILNEKGNDNNDNGNNGIDNDVKELAGQQVDTNPIFKIDKETMDKMNENNDGAANNQEDQKE